MEEKQAEVLHCPCEWSRQRLLSAEEEEEEQGEEEEGRNRSGGGGREEGEEEELGRLIKENTAKKL